MMPPSPTTTTTRSTTRVVALYHDANITDTAFPKDHPMQPFRLELTMALIESLGLHDRLLLPRVVPAAADDMLTFHDSSYIKFLQQSSDGMFTSTIDRVKYNVSTSRWDEDADCPVLPYMWGYITRYVGASLSAARVLCEGGRVNTVINWMGGMHHACAKRASGFCYVNDIVLAINVLLEKFRRVLYIDIDAHHGDGVEEAFFHDRRVVTLSLHQFGNGFFPGTGASTTNGPRDARGYTVNIPLKKHTHDHTYVGLFNVSFTKIIEAFDPEVVVLQCGADSITGDRLGELNVSTHAHAACVERVLSTDLPVMLLGGGGYTASNVARCWAIETAVALGVDVTRDLPKTLPENLPQTYRSCFENDELHVEMTQLPKRVFSRYEDKAQRIDVRGTLMVLQNSLVSIQRDRGGLPGRIEFVVDRAVIDNLLDVVVKDHEARQKRMLSAEKKKKKASNILSSRNVNLEFTAPRQALLNDVIGNVLGNNKEQQRVLTGLFLEEVRRSQSRSQEPATQSTLPDEEGNDASFVKKHSSSTASTTQSSQPPPVPSKKSVSWNLNTIEDDDDDDGGSNNTSRSSSPPATIHEEEPSSPILKKPAPKQPKQQTLKKRGRPALATTRRREHSPLRMMLDVLEEGKERAENEAKGVGRNNNISDEDDTRKIKKRAVKTKKT
eukprot:PhM_4_TR10504/c2_g1_i1/m.106125/K06067/HDAC1_2; histone deacetylase 1/2